MEQRSRQQRLLEMDKHDRVRQLNQLNQMLEECVLISQDPLHKKPRGQQRYRGKLKPVGTEQLSKISRGLQKSKSETNNNQKIKDLEQINMIIKQKMKQQEEPQNQQSK